MSDLPGWNSGVRDYRKDYTEEELSRLIDRFICLYTREPSEEWHHSTDEMMAVLQHAQHAAMYREELGNAYKALRETQVAAEEGRRLLREQRDLLKEYREQLGRTVGLLQSVTPPPTEKKEPRHDEE